MDGGIQSTPVVPFVYPLLNTAQIPTETRGLDHVFPPDDIKSGSDTKHDLCSYM